MTLGSVAPDDLGLSAAGPVGGAVAGLDGGRAAESASHACKAGLEPREWRQSAQRRTGRFSCNRRYDPTLGTDRSAIGYGRERAR